MPSAVSRLGCAFLVAGALACAIACGSNNPISPTKQAPQASTPVATTAAGPSAVSINGAAVLVIGQTKQFTVSTTLVTGATQACPSSPTWESSNPAIAAVSADGSVAAVAAGEVDIKAICQGMAATSHLVVTGPSASITVVSVTVGGPYWLTVGDTVQFIATENLSNGGSRRCTDSAVWESLTPTVVTVAPGGQATVRSAGDAEIKATCEGVSGTARGKAPTGDTVKSVTVSGPNPMAPGQSAQFSATATFYDGTTRNCTSTATWGSNGAGQVSSSGMVTVSNIAAGNVAIQASCFGAWGETLVVVTAGSLYSLSGVAINEKGAPVPGVSVSARSGFSSGSATTDAGGRYRIGGLTPGTAYVTASIAYYDTANATVEISRDTTLDFKLVAWGLNVLGRVFDASIGTGASIEAASVQITTGANAGRTTQTDQNGGYSFQKLDAGAFTIQATKAGYEAGSQTVSLSPDSPSWTTINLGLSASAGCITSVSPVLFNYFPSAGGTGQFSILPVAGRTWAATSNTSWLQVTAGGTGSGPGTVDFHVDANPEGYGTALRKGAIRISCGGASGQDVAVWQLPDCHAAFRTGTTATFEASGATTNVDFLTDSPWTCPWQAISRADWITVRPAAGAGDGTVVVTIAPNTSGAPRTGTLVIAEKTLQINQKGQ